MLDVGRNRFVMLDANQAGAILVGRLDDGFVKPLPRRALPISLGREGRSSSWPSRFGPWSAPHQRVRVCLTASGTGLGSSESDAEGKRGPRTQAEARERHLEALGEF